MSWDLHYSKTSISRAKPAAKKTGAKKTTVSRAKPAAKKTDRKAPAKRK